MAIDKAYIATLRRKRAYLAESGSLAKVQEIDFLLSQAGYKDEPEPPAEARAAVAPQAPRGRQAPNKAAG